MPLSGPPTGFTSVQDLGTSLASGWLPRAANAAGKQQDRPRRMSSPYPEDTATKLPLLKELELVCKQSWRLIAGGAAIGFVIAALSLQGAHYAYPVEMQVTTVQQTGGGGSRSGLSQLSGLASLANISLPTTQNEVQFQLFVEGLFTRDLADEIAKNHDIMVAIYGSEWDEATQTWQQPRIGTMASFKLWLRSLLGLAPTQPWHAPNGENIQSFLSYSLQLTQDPRKPYLATLTMTTGSRELSIRFLNLLVKTLDEKLRRQAVQRANSYIDYLSSKLATVTISEHRDALAQSIGEQERYAMVANSGRPFAAEVFQSPWASNLPSSPSPRQAYITWVFLGAVIGMGIGFWRRRYSDRLAGKAWFRQLPPFVRRSLSA